MVRKSQFTKQILTILQESEKPLTAQEIHQQLPSSDLATVYRNIKKLLEKDEVAELRIKKGESLYEINEDNHQHTVCTVCGKVEHIHIDSEKFLAGLDIEGFEIEDIEITVKGHCKS